MNILPRACTRKALTKQSADTLFHLPHMCRPCGIQPFAEICEARMGTSNMSGSYLSLLTFHFKLTIHTSLRQTSPVLLFLLACVHVIFSCDHAENNLHANFLLRAIAYFLHVDPLRVTCNFARGQHIEPIHPETVLRHSLAMLVLLFLGVQS